MTWAKDKRFSLYALLLVLAVMIFVKVRLHRPDDFKPLNPGPISWDVWGYYLYLPAIFIHNDVYVEDMQWVERARADYGMDGSIYQLTDGRDGRKVDIYSMGIAVINLPGFFIAHVYAKITGQPADGFSAPYKTAMVLTAFAFAVTGLIFFRKLLLHFLDDRIAAAVILLVCLGTNYFYQTAVDSTLPHNYLFALNCIFLWLTIRWHQEKKLKLAFAMGLIFGLSVITRATQVVWVVVPLFYGIEGFRSIKEKVRLLVMHYRHVLLMLLGAFCFGIIQLIYWKTSSGNWIVNGHSESFALMDPYIMEFLFSYKKGWLVYTPIMIFALIGMVMMFSRKKIIALAASLFILIHIYITSSWECWWYAATYSQRPMVETYMLLGLGLGTFLDWVMKRSFIIRFISTLGFGALLFLNGFQTWQFVNGIIDGERMTKKFYWSIFLKTSVDPEYYKYLQVGRGYPDWEVFTKHPENFYKTDLFYYDFEGELKDDKGKNMTDTIAYSGKRCFRVDTVVPFSPDWEDSYSNLTAKYYAGFRISVMVFPTVSPEESNSGLVITFKSGERQYKYTMLDIKTMNLIPGRWQKLELNYLSPEVRHDYDKVQAYYWNMGKAPVFIDDLKGEMFEPKVVY